MAVLSQKKSRVRIEMGDSLGFLKIRQIACFATLARKRVSSRLLTTQILVRAVSVSSQIILWEQ